MFGQFNDRESALRYGINELQLHFIHKRGKGRLESDHYLQGRGQLWTDCGRVWLSHTPARFGLAVKTIKARVVSQ